MGTIYIENRAYEVDSTENLLHVSLRLGFNLPYFCWHPAMGSVGACRQCAVKQFKDEQDAQGTLVMACMTPAAPGTRISIADPEAAQFRAGVIEGLMVNHPHDCPVCDEGGECHLQDMTVMTGHNYRRYRGPKRTFNNQYLGPFLAHEMNRCIQCYRCVRFYRGYAGGHDLNSFSINNTVYFGRHEDGVLENEFAGNLAEVCPTGVFVDRTLSLHYTRKWDTQWAPSICSSCSAGCNISPGERYNMVRRIVNRYHPDINGYFICDRGRYSYEFANSEQRIRRVLARSDGALAPAHRQDALKRLAGLLSGGAIGIGSPRASVEANFALRAAVGEGRFYAGVPEREWNLLRRSVGILRTTLAHIPSLREIESCDAVFVLGEDVSNTAPRMALSIRQSTRRAPMKKAAKLKIPEWNDQAVRQIVQNESGPLFVATPAPTRLDDVATRAYRAAPDDIARLGYAVAAELGGGAPVEDLHESVLALAREIAAVFRGCDRPLIVSGLSLASEACLDAAASVAAALHAAGKPANLALVPAEANSVGLALTDAPPLEAAFDALGRGNETAVVVLENDLLRRKSSDLVRAALSMASHVAVIDHLMTRTVDLAELVFPAGAFAESDGTFVNYEGRAQRFFQVYPPGDDIQESWRWLRDAMAEAGRTDAREWRGLDEVICAAAGAMPAFEGIENSAPPAAFRASGTKIPRQPHRFSGRTSMFANITVHEPAPAPDADSPLAFSMEGHAYRSPPEALPFVWAPNWNSGRAFVKYHEEVSSPDAFPKVLLLARRNGAASPALQHPPAFRRREGEWLFIPLFHIFGSEELTHWAPAIMSLAPAPYLALAASAGFTEGETLQLSIDGASMQLPVVVMAALPDGVAGLPYGLPQTEGLDLPSWGSIARPQ